MNNFPNRRQFGFTLIELLVIVAIIGILSSVIIIFLNIARNKGDDAKVKTQLSSARATAEIYYDTNKHYSPVGTIADSCSVGMFTNTTSGMSAYMNTANYPAGTTITCHHNATAGASASAYSIDAKLSTTDGGYWCIDNTGVSKRNTTVQGAGDVTCK
ncbi:hypothetical protein A3D66_01405 [Candidatus Kaiserbacteria bacterium RIFCSPHIGHO2_02_FULL_50_9]|uniref:Type II secretion system protein GspG C-terminal domain-containing protein n=1 Tax=Candidatus Kaiserbacteria bacterium RIFCSPLOWO2_01_FULL_51_21 TaxID=1798508 RepID=A0A1F6ECQ3_9BACT|nr:MAG: hypothetical protein A2761_00995 [Candidatus Kaiserbacteria bacterium RIFCSPHIGHO2_01_FULL_51_33]OGG63301.1 MAG: hypothetical protein A3D66_01405 [Candidatus Kaiserbacteria bacterium RIFCSPHIGHO2_02_FULL_50_9]OGG71455.1 MAG: hypothetical protein A3A35_03355 [Candidatus Kaiserbacteria bacterium RIFCSPLOWO2_01_FULL_51_21]